MWHSSRLDGAIALALAFAAYPLFESIVQADATNLACVPAHGVNCGQVTDDMQCRIADFDPDTNVNCHGGDCGSCNGSTAINIKICVPREGSDDCQDPESLETVECGTQTSPGVCKKIGGMPRPCMCDISGPPLPEEQNLCKQIPTCGEI